MSHEHLSAHFTGAAAKRLSEVEVNPARSNQHEFQGTVAIRALLGDTTASRPLDARFVWLTDEAEPFVVDSTVTYYDARANQTKRSPEYRLYYPSNEVTARVSAGDLLLIAPKVDGDLVVVIAAAGTSIESQILWLFELGEVSGGGFSLVDEAVLGGELHPVDAEILVEAFGIEPDVTESTISEVTIARFGLTLPSTAVFSEFARSLVPEVDALKSPDQTLMTWWETEYKAFQALEHHIVSRRVTAGFHGNAAVEEFLSFSLSVQNRRKSRSGHAFENHLAELFRIHGLNFDTQSKTERGAKPDFLFPGQREYDDATFLSSQLFMLGAKTTAKDRWRQVLSEADRIPVKHLATLEPAISTGQTTEMQSHGLQLVVPAPLHSTYTEVQQNWLWTIADFIVALG